MCPRRVSHTVLQISVLQIIFVALVIVAIRSITYPLGQYHYEHIERNRVLEHLYRVRSPDIRDVSTVKCQYKFVASTETIAKEDIAKRISELNEDGIANGSYVPCDCNPMFSTAILVTYRNRQDQLNKFIPYMHTFLRKQNIHYKIFVIELKDDSPWNKGALYNVGAKIAIAEKFPCLILHDVDMLPLDTANIYACTYYPRHMSASVDKFRYVLPYEGLVGGVLAIQSRHYVDVNGFSNKFEGWGAEDDDFARRLYQESLPITRFHPEMSRYTMLVHPQEAVNDNRFSMLRKTDGHHQEDGLNTVKYESLTIRPQKLYTLIAVRLANDTDDDDNWNKNTVITAESAYL